MVLRALVVGLALSLLTVPALAQQSGWYFGLRAGATWLQDANNRPDNAAPPGSVGAKTRYDTGYNAGGFAGYSWNPLRLEAEISQHDNSLSSVTPSGGATVSGSGDVSALAFMANLYYDFSTGTAFTPYVGFGAGFASVHANSLRGAGSTLTINSSDMPFAYQGIVGVSYAFDPQWSVAADYRYLST